MYQNEEPIIKALQAASFEKLEELQEALVANDFDFMDTQKCLAGRLLGFDTAVNGWWTLSEAYGDLCVGAGVHDYQGRERVRHMRLWSLVEAEVRNRKDS